MCTAPASRGKYAVNILTEKISGQGIWRFAAAAALFFCLVFGAYMAWKLTFYAAWQSGAGVKDGYPLVYQPPLFIKIVKAQAKLPFFVHGIAGVTAMLSGAVQFLLILRATGSRWHKVLGKVYAMSALVASTTAIPMAWSLHYDMLVTSVAYTLGGTAWCLATLLAVHCAMKGDLDGHVAWIIRSYCYLAMVVTARLFLVYAGIAGAEDWDFQAVKILYSVVIPATFFINLGLGEWIVARVKARTRN